MSRAETIPAIPKAVGTVQVEASIRYAAWWNLENSFVSFDAYCDSRRLANQQLGACSNRLYTPLPVYSNNPAGDCIYEQIWWGTRSCAWLTTGNIHYVCPEGYTHWATDHTRCINTQIEYTCPPDQGWTLSGDKCTREYTIELDRGNATIEPTGTAAQNVQTSQEFIATVKGNGNPKSGAVVTIRAAAKANTGGHDHHDDNRPTGTLSSKDNTASRCGAVDEKQACITGTTNGNGQFTFAFTSSPVSGEHTLTATCNLCAGNQDKADVKVMVEGLAQISDSVYYALIEDGSTKVIGRTDEHASNHHIASAAQLKLWLLAQAFYEYQLRNGAANPTLLHLNDASLKWGGLFDKDGDWETPHKEHRRGSVIDIRANSSPGAIPRDLTKNFEKIAEDLGIDPHLEYDDDPVLRHFHTRLLNRGE